MKPERLVMVAAVAMVVAAAVGIGTWALVDSRPRTPRPEATDYQPASLPRLSDESRLPAEYRAAAHAVAGAITKGGERPQEFAVEIEPKSDGTVTFHLWHESAFEPQNRGGRGNPGGKCRDARFDPRTGAVVDILFWQ